MVETDRPLLDVREITVRFGGHTAVSAVDLDVHAGEIVGLIGPNGAGKTTTFNCITGLQSLDSGSVHLAGQDVSAVAPHKRARLGMARTFQRLEVFASMTATDNVRTAVEMRQRWSRERGGDVAAEAQALLERVGLGADGPQRADALPTGHARLLEVARALAARPRLLLLDEPASGLTDSESEELADLLRSLRDEGVAVLLVEHDVPLVMAVCDRIHVLDFGVKIAEGTPEQIQRDPRVLAAYLGAPKEVA